MISFYQQLEKEGPTLKNLEEINNYMGKGRFTIIKKPRKYKIQCCKRLKEEKSDPEKTPTILRWGKIDLDRIGKATYQDKTLRCFVTNKVDGCPYMLHLEFNPDCEKGFKKAGYQILLPPSTR